jgi:hypothetical protein
VETCPKRSDGKHEKTLNLSRVGGTVENFNILWQEVETLVSEKLSAGSYKYRWDAGNLASGVYLYRMEADGFVQTRKMIFLK